MDHLLILTLMLWMPISMVIGTWSEGLWISGWRICLPNPRLSKGMKTRSKTELESWELSMNIVGPRFDRGDNSRPRLSAMVNKSSVCIEW